MGKGYTREEIDRMDNGQLPNVFRTGGGWNRRHQWIIDTGSLGSATEDFKPRNSVSNAEQYVSAAGSRLVPAEHAIHIANSAAEAVGVIRTAGLPLPAEIRIDSSIFRSLDRSLATPGYFVLSSNSVYLNPGSRFFAGGSDGMAHMTRAAYERGWWSTDSPLGPVLHELGHAAHWGSSQQAYREAQHMLLSKEEGRMVRRRLSEYGSIDPLELVAEVVASKLTGFLVHPDVIELYRRFGGPRL
jgi:hypothetical protein